MDKLDKPKLILKVGTATLTQGRDIISRAKLEDIAIQISALREKYDIILVCSGAIAAAKQFIKLEKIGDQLTEKQALASIGQPYLMRLIQESFRDYGIPVGQCLLSYTDLVNDTSKENIVNTINVLLKNGILPVINENDTTATEEIRFGDNDKLSALAAVHLEADLLILATNTHGVYDHHQNTIKTIKDIAEVKQFVQTDLSRQGTGGMESKLMAAELAQQANIESWIVNGHEKNFLVHALNGQSDFSIIKC